MEGVNHAKQISTSFSKINGLPNYEVTVFSTISYNP